MRALLIASLLLPCLLRAEVLIPGTLSFDPPPFLYGSQPGGDPGDNPFSGVGQIREYLDSAYQSKRQLNVNVRMVGFTIGEGKRVTFQTLDDKALKAEMQATIKTGQTNPIPDVVETNLGGQPALLMSCQVQRGKDASVQFEAYWVRFQTNRVIEVLLIAESPERMKSLKEAALPRFKITKQTH